MTRAGEKNAPHWSVKVDRLEFSIRFYVKQSQTGAVLTKGNGRTRYWGSLSDARAAAHAANAKDDAMAREVAS